MNEKNLQREKLQSIKIECIYLLSGIVVGMTVWVYNN